MKHLTPLNRSFSPWTQGLLFPTQLIITPYYSQDIPSVVINQIIKDFNVILKKNSIGSIIENARDENGLTRIVFLCYTPVSYKTYKSLITDKPVSYSWMAGTGQDLFLRFIDPINGHDMRTHFIWDKGNFTTHL